jgi:hypothetical protein
MVTLRVNTLLFLGYLSRGKHGWDHGRICYIVAGAWEMNWRGRSWRETYSQEMIVIYRQSKMNNVKS